MAFEDNETYSQGTLYSATENQVTETQKSSQLHLLWFIKKRKQPLVLRTQPDSPTLCSGNNHKSKLSLYQKWVIQKYF